MPLQWPREIVLWKMIASSETVQLKHLSKGDEGPVALIGARDISRTTTVSYSLNYCTQLPVRRCNAWPEQLMRRPRCVDEYVDSNRKLLETRPIAANGDALARNWDRQHRGKTDQRGQKSWPNTRIR
jgi:hypothetical protein